MLEKEKLLCVCVEWIVFFGSDLFISSFLGAEHLWYPVLFVPSG
jgi:hypothetical protein